MSGFSTALDDFSDITGPILEVGDDDEEPDPNFKCDMSLEEITAELLQITTSINAGGTYDEKRLDYLIRAQDNNMEFQRQMEEERLEWQESIFEFSTECLERTRSFVPVDIFSATLKSLQEQGLTYDVAKRILDKRCLWLVRMSSAEIARLHEVDLYQRFNCTAQYLDIIELAGIYASLPEVFSNDGTGKKKEWRDTVENLLKKMLLDNESDSLTPEQIRNPVYEGLQYGPITDTTSVRENKVVSSEGSLKPKQSFLGLCRSNSVLFRASLKKSNELVDIFGSNSDKVSK